MNLSDQAFRESSDAARRHLLLSFPEPELEYEGDGVIDATVEGAIHNVLVQSGPVKILLVREVQSAILNLTGLEFETSEVVESLERLQKANRLEFRDTGHHSFVFSEQRFIELDRKLQSRVGRDETVRSEWFKELSQRHSFAEGQLPKLWEGLERFLAALVNTHAAEAAAYLYQNNDVQQVRFYNILSARLPSIEDYVDAELVDVAKQEFVAFFDVSDSVRVDYISDRLQAAFFYHLLSIDPHASELVRANVSEKILYLDTNFLFRLMGLQGPSLAHAPAMTVMVSEKLNCKLCVAGETLDEFIRSLRGEIGRLRNIPIERDVYQRIAAEQPGGEWTFMQAYYREYLGGKVKNVEQFERKYSNVTELLRRWGIEIDQEARLDDDERANSDFIDERSQLNLWHNSNKSPAAIDHDLFMLRHLRRLRGAHDLTAGMVRYWFLTYDRRLTSYAVYHASTDRLSPCMLADSWLQLTRPFLPRTADYEKSFVALLRHPLLYKAENIVPFEHVAEAINRLERYEELPAPMVAAMVADGEFLRRLQATRDEQAERELIELKMSSIAQDMASKNESLQEELARSHHRIQLLEKTVDEIKSKNTAAEREVASAQSAMQQAEMSTQELIRQMRTDTERQIEAVEKAAAAHFDRMQAELSKKVGQGIRWTIYGALSLTITTVSAIILWVRWDGLSTYVAVVGGWWLLVLILLLGIPLRDRLGSIAAVASVVGMLLGLIGLSYQLISEPARSQPVEQSGAGALRAPQGENGSP